MFKTFLICVSLILFTGCSVLEKKITLNGRIDSKLYSQIQSHNSIGKTIQISSNGGETAFSIKIAHSIIENDNFLEVFGYCISACAEDLLPAASGIRFVNLPIIGFHRNSFMNRDQMIRFGGDVTNCSNKGIEDQAYLHKLRGLKEDFWKETEKRLVLTYYKVVPKGSACPWKKRKFRNYLWLPTSSQLKELWGLEFSGLVCSDKLEACKIKIDRKWKAGTRIVIGDEVYVSKGR